MASLVVEVRGCRGQGWGVKASVVRNKVTHKVVTRGVVKGDMMYG